MCHNPILHLLEHAVTFLQGASKSKPSSACNFIMIVIYLHVIYFLEEFLTKELSCIPKEDMVKAVLDHGINIRTLRHMDKLLLLRYIYYLLQKLIFIILHNFLGCN